MGALNEPSACAMFSETASAGHCPKVQQARHFRADASGVLPRPRPLPVLCRRSKTTDQATRRADPSQAVDLVEADREADAEAKAKAVRLPMHRWLDASGWP